MTCPQTGGDHRWFECFRQSDPPARVFDCGCGARRKLYGSETAAEIENVTPNPGGSVANCLVHIDGMSVMNQLGDPQAARLQALNATQETSNG